MNGEIVQLKEEAWFDKCPKGIREEILLAIGRLDIKGIKIETELSQFPSTTGGPTDCHVPTGVMIYTIRGYKSGKKGGKNGRRKE
jgi:hypothetical protein